MDSFYVFIIRNDIWIYILCTFGLIWYLNEFWRAQSILRRAMFNLERESGHSIRNTSLIFILFFITVIGSVYYVNNQVAPTLPAELLIPSTPTPNIFITPLSSPTPLGTPPIAPPTATPPLVPTVTLAGDTPIDSNSAGDSSLLIETPIVAPPPTPFIGCNLVLNITTPRDRNVIESSVTFLGTAEFENFGSYRMEINGPQTSGRWASLLGREINQTVNDGFLGSANLQGWASGPYLIRLAGIDANGNEIGQCVIQVTLADS